MTLPMPFKLLDWIDDNREHLKPPVCNKEMFVDGGFIVQVVGGPNSRTDYHVDEGPELFYQVEGEMPLKTVQDGELVGRVECARAGQSGQELRQRHAYLGGSTLPQRLQVRAATLP